MKKLLILTLALTIPAIAGAQIQYTWHPVPMDSTWDEIKDPAATKIIEKYSPQVAVLQEIIGYTDQEYTKHFPESGLSNYQVDVIRKTAEKLSGEPVDIALTNFGGIRTSLPKGAVRVYDIYSIFPFDNYILYFDIQGSDLRKVLQKMIDRGRIEVLSNVEIVVKGKEALKMKVAGAPIDDNRTYRMATINFLLDGGDGVSLKSMAHNLVETKVYIRDAIVDYMREQMERGETIVLKEDGRVKFID